jgi:hypothetical protein
MSTFALSSAAVALAASSLLSPLAQAQTSQIYIENAKTWGGGNTLYLYGVPIKNAVGDPVTKYWDLQVVLEATPDTARPNKATVVGATPSAKVKKAGFVQGDYTLGTIPCHLEPSTLAGRTQYDLNCATSSNQLKITWYTGPITGHPDEAAIRAAGLDSIVGAEEYGWGRVVYNSTSYWGGCYLPFGHLTGARQVGDVLTINNYGNNSALDCQINLVRTPTGQ